MYQSPSCTGTIYTFSGRVLVVESNGVGFYFVVYIPKTYVNYEIVRNNIKEGILQGFSKEGGHRITITNTR